MKQNTKIQGFTLIELLVVIAIIAILGGLLLPAVTKVKQKGYESQARTELKGIEAAVKAYLNEYAKLPLDDADQGKNVNSNIDGKQFDGVNSKPIFRRLTGDNPRKIVFLEAQATDGTYLNPWGNQYGLYLDNNYNNELRFGTNIVRGQVVVYSRGPGTNMMYSIRDMEKWRL